ncbi:MAG: DUF3352 domain-containing protein [Actinomycetota bacterium]|nr:DUF3352 domain-containing protein [Actinomycetota bacterium]
MRCPTKRRRPLAAALSAALALALGACGEEGGSDPAQVAPAKAAVWVDAVIDPQGEQEQAVRSILGRFPRGGEVPQLIARAIEKEAREEKTPIDFERDVKPWLGDRAGLFLTSVGRGEPQVGLVLSATDEGKARAFLEKLERGHAHRERTHKGVDYTLDEDGAHAVVEGFVVVTQRESDLRAAIDAAKGSSLADSDRYRQATDDLEGDRIATAYLDSRALVALSGPGEQQRQVGKCVLGRAAQQPLVASVRAEPDAVAVDSATSGEGGLPTGLFLGTEPGLLPSLPADSWLAFGQPDLGPAVKRVVDCLSGALGGEVARQQFKRATRLDLDRDVLSWMGDAGLFVRGTNQADLGGALVIETKDPAASRRALTKVLPAVRAQAEGARVTPSTLSDVDAGFTVRSPGGRGPELHAAQRGRRVVLAFGGPAAEDGLTASRPLSGAASFKDAAASLGEDYAAALYVSVQPILAVLETGGVNRSRGYRRALPYLEKLNYLVVGNRRDDERLRTRYTLKLAK